MSGIYDKREIPDDLQQYFVRAELGLESTPEEYVSNMVDVFRLVRELLADDGTLWLNLGDSYGPFKQLLGMPWRVALALQNDGWVLRQDIIWHKPNPMPESVLDRCTKAHEYIFLLSKSQKYFFDSEAMQEPASQPRGEAKLTGQHKADAGGFTTNGHGKSTLGSNQGAETRNRRSVWSVATRPYAGAHFATFPPELIQPCIIAGSRPGDIVLDPFLGSGTVAEVSERFGRQWIGCELNPDYAPLQHARTAQKTLNLW